MPLPAKQGIGSRVQSYSTPDSFVCAMNASCLWVSFRSAELLNVSMQLARQPNRIHPNDKFEHINVKNICLASPSVVELRSICWYNGLVLFAPSKGVSLGTSLFFTPRRRGHGGSSTAGFVSPDPGCPRPPAAARRRRAGPRAQ